MKPSVAKPSLAIEWWPIDKPQPYGKNPRKPSPSAVRKVAASIKEFGWRQPIVVDAHGVIVAGHKRMEAARSLAMTQVPVHVARELTPAQCKAFRLMDNRSQDDSEWDLELLACEIGELAQLENVDLALTGFDQSEIDEYMAHEPPEDVDEVIEPPAAPVAVLGDVWLLGAHRVACGSSVDADAVAKLLGDHKPFLMITDPPYGISLDNEWRDRAGLNGCGPAEPSYLRTHQAEGAKKKKRSKGHTEHSISGDTISDWSPAFELVPSLQVAYVWHASLYTSEVKAGLERLGFLYPQQIIWDKQRMALTRTHYWFSHEPCWYVRKKNAPWYGEPGKNATIWQARSPKMIMGGSDEEKFDHPTQKPIELMRKPLLNHTRRGESVYEPFLGSGTTLAAAELTGRVCYGMELDPKYVDVVILRWQSLSGQTATLEGSGLKTFDMVAAERKDTSAQDRKPSRKLTAES